MEFSFDKLATGEIGALTRSDAHEVAKRILAAVAADPKHPLNQGTECHTEVFGDGIYEVSSYIFEAKRNPFREVTMAFHAFATERMHARDLRTWMTSTAKTGRMLLPFAEHVKDDLVFTAALNVVALSLLDRGQTNRMPDRDDLESLLHAARWAQYQFPTVRLTAGQAASLALSDVTDEQLAEVRMPWPALVLHCSDAFSTPTQRMVAAAFRSTHSAHSARLSGHPDDRLLSSELAMHDGAGLHISSGTPKNLYSLADDPVTEGEVNQLTARMAAMVARAMLNVCVALSSKEASLERIPTKKRKRRRGRRAARHAEPTDGVPTGQYTLGLPVKVSMVEHLRRYLTAASARSYKARWIVRGHWRNQAYGPRHGLRRRQWIPPHPKGPRESPKLIREHELGGGGSNGADTGE